MLIDALMAWDGGWFGLLVAALIIGLVVGFFGARAFIKRELKKHPPIDEKTIRAMYMQMGRKPTEAQIRAVMNSMKKNSDL